jgi:UDP-hydrolysing UDP-N-acetyl-D-glucosamine 2-epimerase
MRTIGVVTVGRSDYGIYLPILRRIQAEPGLVLRLLVTGMHLSPEFGRTAQLIENDGFVIHDRVEMLLSSDTPEAIGKSMGLGVLGFAQVYARQRPDLLVVLGDRFEMYAAALAALPFKIPIAHIHGGEVTEGAIDEALRHSLTKLAHLHFVSAEAYARRILQMGEEEWRVIVSGAPSLDNLSALRLLSRRELEKRLGLHLDRPPLLVTFHPVTLEYEHVAWQVEELLAALAESGFPLIFTRPNADTNGRIAGRLVEEFVQQQPGSWLADNLGTQGYFSLMACASAVVGNSSSGIIEAPSLKVPVVNIGTRQRGRLRAANVIDTDYPRAAILAAIRQATSPAFRKGLRNLRNPFGDGSAAEIIVARLKEQVLDDRLVRKRFCDLSKDVECRRSA